LSGTMSHVDSEQTLEALQLQLAETQQENRYLLDALRLSPMALCHQDTSLRYTWLQNPHMGFTMEESIGKTDWDLLPQDLADRMGEIKRRVVATGVGERAEIPTVPGDKQSEYFELIVEPIWSAETETLLGITCSGMDVTEDRRRREAYKSSEENLKFIFNASPFAIMVLDSNARNPVFFNLAADRLFALSRLSDQTLPDQPLSFSRLLGVGDDFFSHLDDEVTDINVDYTNLEGSLLSLSMSARPIYYDGSATLLVAFHDLTEQLRAQAQLRDLNACLEQRVLERTDELTKMNAALEASNRAKTDFLAKMSHELRTPLNSIIGYTRRLLSKLEGQLDTRHMDALDAVFRNGEHLLGLINGLLDLSKIEAGQMSLRSNPVHVGSLLSDVVSKIEPLISEKKLGFVVDGMHSDDVIMADPQRLLQILLNLLSNAQKFTDEGKVIIRYFREDGWACFVVEDTGSGIAKQDVDDIFGEYKQAQHNKGGTGLGLALVKQLVALHQGSIEIFSELGVGTRCLLRLPYKEQPFLARRSKAASSG